MKEETGYFSSFDGTELFYRWWNKGVPDHLFLIHGFGEHSGRYLEFIHELEALPISIAIYDLRGHGRSKGERVYVKSFDELINDTDQFRSLIEQKVCGFQKPPILFGHSLGALIAILSVLRDESQWRSLILMSPYFCTYVLDGVMGRLAQCLDFFIPKWIWKNPVNPIFLSHDPKEVEGYLTDPLLLRRITTRMAKEMYGAGGNALCRAQDIHIPLLVLAAGDDKIVSLKKTKQFFDQAQSRDKVLEIFHNFYHELLHEQERQKPISVFKKYLEKLLQ